jgi:hypothetical protein
MSFKSAISALEVSAGFWHGKAPHGSFSHLQRKIAQLRISLES